jgi:ABC-type sugar transport system ATPase subunit
VTGVPAQVGPRAHVGLECEDLWLSYAPGLPFILKGVSLAVGQGEVVAVVGHNGAGKSTVVKTVAGTVRAQAGQVRLDGRRIDGLSVREIKEAGVSCVWQELSVVPTMSVWDNLLLGMADRGRLIRRPARARRSVQALVERCDLTNIDLRQTVGSLKFVDRQRVEIARALASESRYLLLDEPTAGQRGAAREDLFELIRSSARQGVGVLLVNHHLDEVIELAERAVVLRDGVVVGELAGAAMTAEAMAALMSGARTPDPTVPGSPAPQVQPAGGDISAEVPDNVAGSAVAGEVRLRCSDLRTDTLASTALELHGGRVYGFYGQEGAGQSELIKVLAGAVVPRGGRIEVDGRQVRFRHPADAVRRGVVYLSGDRAEMIVPALSGSDNLLLSTMGASPLWRIAPNRRSRERMAGQLTEHLEVRGNWRGPITGLSGGNQQKLIVGRVLGRPHAAVLLEGPTLGVDVEARAHILRMIRDLASARQSTVCLASEDENEVIDACDHVFVMAAGSIVERFDIDPGVTKERLRAAAVAARPTATGR